MAAPSLTALTAATGVALTEGFSHRAMFARNPTIGLWFKKSKPMGFDNGGAIDTTTQDRTVGDFRTKAAPALIDATDLTGQCAYDPTALAAIKATLMGRGNEGAISYYFMDGTTVTFFGYIDKADPAETGEKEQPMLNVTIVVTNWDPVNKVYAAPVWAQVSGT